MFTCWMIFLMFHSLCLSSIFFLCIPLIHHWHCLILKLAIPAEMCLWIPLVKFHFSCCIFQLWQKRFWFPFRFSSSLFISVFCWYIISLTFSTTSFSSLIMNTVVLMSFSRRSAITFFFSDNDYWFIFLFWMGHPFLFLCMPCNFFVVENWTFEFNIVISLEIRFCPCPRVSWVLLLFLIVVSCVCPKNPPEV